MTRADIVGSLFLNLSDGSTRVISANAVGLGSKDLIASKQHV